MGSDDTHVTDPELPVQETETASAAKTTSSDGSGGFVGRGASRPSSSRHQEQERVQNLKDRCEVMDVPMGPEINLIHETTVPVQEREITSDSSVRSGRADPTPPDSSVGGDGSGAPCPWSLTQEEHVRNLKENLRRVFGEFEIIYDWPDLEDDPCFAKVVAQMRANPCLDHSELEVFNKKGHGFIEGVRPLHLAVLMGDPEMVQKILETPLGQNEINFSIAEYPRYDYTALDLTVVGGESKIENALREKNAQYLYSGLLQRVMLHGHVNQTEWICRFIQT